MIEGVRRPAEIVNMGLSNRLKVRVGALLKKGLALTPILLETAREVPAVEEFLLAPILLNRAGTFTLASLEELLSAQPNLAALSRLTLSVACDGVQVLCLQEEIDAAEWSDVSTETEVETKSSSQAKSEIQTLSLRERHNADTSRSMTVLQESVSGSASSSSGIFPPQELDRLRLKLLTASAPLERMESLRILCLAPLSLEAKIDILLQALNDRDPSVRAEGAGLLSSVGADREITEALAALNHAESHRREAALDRLCHWVVQNVGSTQDAPNSKGLEIGAIAVCVLAILRQESFAIQFEQQIGRILDLLRLCAPQLAHHVQHVNEVVRRVFSQVSTTAKQGNNSRQLDAMIHPAYKLLYSLGRAVPRPVIAALHVERERCSDSTSEALILQLLLDLLPPLNFKAGGDQEAQESQAEIEILKLAATYLGRDRDEGRDSRSVGSRLLQRGEKSFAVICETFSSARPAAQKYFLLLMDDLWRMYPLSASLLDQGAELVLKSIQTGSKGMGMTAAQCRFVADPNISDELRRRLSEALLKSVTDFTFSFDREKVEQTVVRMGFPALDVLLERLASQRPAEERARAIRILGDLALELKAPEGYFSRLQEGVTEALRRVQSFALEIDFPDRGELYCVMGKLASSPAASKEAGGVIERILNIQARDADLKVSSRALEGLTYLAASRRAQPELVAGTATLLRQLMANVSFEITTELHQINGEKVLELTGGDSYTLVLPIALRGLARIACSSGCPISTTSEILHFLIDQWRRICRAEVVWGPANTQLLIQALKEIGMSPGLSADHRRDLLKALVPKLMQMSMMHAVTEILAADDTSTSANNALTVGVAIFSRRGADAQFQMEDRSEILKALTRLTGRKWLGASGNVNQKRAEDFRRMVVEELFKGLRDSVSGSYESLVVLYEKKILPSDLQADVEQRLSALHAVVVR